MKRLALLILLVLFVAVGVSYAVDKATVQKRVNEAAKLIAQKGETAFDILNKKDQGEWKDQGYVFVLDTQGVTYVHIRPALIGKNVINAKDPYGVYFIKECIKTAINKGEGWVKYHWPKPGENKPSPKITFVKKVKAPSGKIYVVGAGIYEK